MNKRNRKNAFVLTVFTIGLLIMSYPFYSSAINRVWDSRTMKRYYRQESIRFEEQKKAAMEHNSRMVQGAFAPGSDPFEDVSTDHRIENSNEHFLGSVSIPRLQLDVPLFDTTTPSLLEVGATVLDGTSQPLGGETSHSVITGHRGLPNRELFTNLPKLEIGDIFIINSLGEQMAYQVIETSIVLPHETDSLKIVSGQDLVTLVTCTPYMINTHRLLVTGSRVELTSEVQAELKDSLNLASIKHTLIIAGLLSILLLFLVIFVRLLRRNNNQ